MKDWWQRGEQLELVQVQILGFQYNDGFTANALITLGNLLFSFAQTFAFVIVIICKTILVQSVPTILSSLYICDINLCAATYSAVIHTALRNR